LGGTLYARYGKGAYVFTGYSWFRQLPRACRARFAFCEPHQRGQNGAMTPEMQRRIVPDEPPPFLGKWSRVYAAVLIYVAALITLFYFFTKAFTR
jgi:hypothetical protein